MSPLTPSYNPVNVLHILKSLLFQMYSYLCFPIIVQFIIASSSHNNFHKDIPDSSPFFFKFLHPSYFHGIYLTLLLSFNELNTLFAACRFFFSLKNKYDKSYYSVSDNKIDSNASCGILKLPPPPLFLPPTPSLLYSSVEFLTSFMTVLGPWEIYIWEIYLYIYEIYVIGIQFLQMCFLVVPKILKRLNVFMRNQNYIWGNC